MPDLQLSLSLKLSDVRDAGRFNLEPDGDLAKHLEPKVRALAAALPVAVGGLDLDAATYGQSAATDGTITAMLTANAKD